MLAADDASSRSEFLDSQKDEVRETSSDRRRRVNVWCGKWQGPEQESNCDESDGGRPAGKICVCAD